MGSKTLVIAIEGLIGAGKTSLLHELQNNNGRIQISTEPVHLWNNVSGRQANDKSQNMLVNMYEDPKRWCFSFQIWALCTRLQSISVPHNSNVYVVERCVDSNLVFAATMHDLGYMDECEWTMFKHIYDYMKPLQPQIDAIVWLDCDFDECMRRILQRNRIGESNVSKEYQIKLYQRYMCWLNKTEIPVLILDSTHQDSAELAVSFDNFVKSLQV